MDKADELAIKKIVLKTIADLLTGLKSALDLICEEEIGGETDRVYECRIDECIVQG